MLFFIVCNNTKVNLKANEDTTQNLFEDFTCERVRECYYCEEVSGEYIISRTLQLYIGTCNNNDSYVLYSTENNLVIEYSFNSNHPWTGMQGNIYILVFSNDSNHYVSLLKDEMSSETNYLFYYDSQNYTIDNALGPSFETTLEYEINNSNFNYTDNVIKQNSISNSFYFENLNLNYGDNNNHACSQLAISMYLAYINEFLDNKILPDTLDLIYTEEESSNTYSITKDSYYNVVYENNFDITCFESPGANDLLHQFIIKYGYNLYGQNENITQSYQTLNLIDNYLESYYDSSNVGMRIISDVRYVNANETENLNNEYPESYEYYESIVDREQLKRDEDQYNYSEYEFDIFTEIDNGNPVVLFLYDGIWELNLENYNETSLKGCTNLPMGHVAIVYGYALTESGIYYRCHFGHKVNNENYNNNDVWVKAASLNSSGSLINSGFVIKKFNNSYENEKSSYYYNNENCIINLPTSKVFKTYEEFAVSTGKVNYDNLSEFYYCYCDNPHLLYQQKHSFKFHEMDYISHIKYCDCGYSENENHDKYHETIIDGHYELCKNCSYSNAHAEGVTYETLQEFQHIWHCQSCDLSGVANHCYYFEKATDECHYSYCFICDYENLVGHGYEFDIWYYRIDDNTHKAYCSCCGEEWIELHSLNCSCT